MLQAQTGSGFTVLLLQMAAIGLVFYFLILRPSSQARKKHAELLGSLKKNDEVLTSSGIYGVVSSIKEGADEVTLKIDDNAKIRVLKSSIVRIMNPKEPPKEGAPKEGS